jgi:hypothetical protein
LNFLTDQATDRFYEGAAMFRLTIAVAILFSIHAFSQESELPPKQKAPEEEQAPGSVSMDWMISKYGAQWKKALEDAPQYNFNFVRFIWSPLPGMSEYHSDKSFWHVDYPKGDKCLLKAIREVTDLRGKPLVTANPLPVIMKPDDKMLGMFPFAFITEAGWVNFSDAEAKNLGQWLRKGGFLLVDDFHGPLASQEESPSGDTKESLELLQRRINGQTEWAQWMVQLKRAIPEIKETRKTWSLNEIEYHRGDWVTMRLDINHPVFNVFFSHSEIPHVKGTRPEQKEWEEGSSQHYIMGLFNPKGVLVALMNYNMDVGDGWEFCAEMDQTFYGRTQVPAGLKLGVNYVIYSLTH